MRNEQGDKMEDWDEKKLEDVVDQKHGEDNKKKNTTQIVICSLLEFTKRMFTNLDLIF